MSLRVLTCLAVSLSLMIAADAGATVITVPTDAGDIQTAINMASNDDTVYVEANTYSGPGNRDIQTYGKSILVQAEWGTVIEVDSYSSGTWHTAFIFDMGETRSTIIDGFTIQPQGMYLSYADGCAFRVEGTSPLIRNCTMSHLWTRWYGSAVYIDGGSPRIEHCTFDNNTVGASATKDGQKGGGAGAGLYATNSTAEVVDCYFYSNFADAADGPALSAFGGNVQITDCIFESNTAVDGDTGDYGRGGAVFGHGTFAECEFLDNRSYGFGSGGSGGAVCGYGDFDFCVFASNEASDMTSSGGAIYSLGGSVHLTNCTFAYNQASRGTALFLTDGSSTAENTIVAFNEYCCPDGPPNTEVIDVDAGLPGACIAMTCCDVYGNEGGDWVGCISSQAGSNGNFSDDPDFCTSSFGLETTSPCLPDANTCGVLIGALGPNCCCIRPTVGDLDQSGQPSPMNVDGIDLSIMLDMLFISLEPIDCLVEADLDYSGQPAVEFSDIDGIDLSIMLDALFISLTPPGPCP